MSASASVLRRREGLNSFVSGGTLQSLENHDSVPTPLALTPIPPNEDFISPSWACPPGRTGNFLVGYDMTGVEVARHCIDEQSSCTLLGRYPELSDITLDIPTTSRRHAALLHHRCGSFFIVDCGSVNGTFLDGKLLKKWQPYPIFPGSSRVKFATGDLTFALIDSQLPSQVDHSSSNGKHRPSEASGSESKRKKIDENLPSAIRCSHILVKHKQSRRPASWKQSVISRSKEEAMELIKEYHQMIAQGKVKFADLAARESDCSSAKRGGDLGRFGRGKMQPAFEEAAFALEKDELSDVVVSDSGIHVILRTE